MKKIIIVMLALILTACSTTQAMQYYKSENMNLNTATAVIDELIMSQHRKWRPDYVEITDKYLHFGFGSITKSVGGAALVSNVAIGESTSVTRQAADRIYYNRVNSVKLLSWKRNGKQWYIVSSENKDSKLTHIYRTQDLNEAKKFYDALESVLENFKRTS